MGPCKNQRKINCYWFEFFRVNFNFYEKEIPTFKSDIRLFLWLQHNFTAFWPTFPTYDSLNRGRLKYLTSLGTVLYNNHALNLTENNFISKDEKIVYNYFFGKLKILLNHGFLRPILSTKHPSQIGLGNPW